MKRYTDQSLAGLQTPKAGAKVLRITDDGLYVKIRHTGRRTFGYLARNAQGNPQFRPFAHHAVGDETVPGTLTLDEAHAKWLTIKAGNIADAARQSAPVPLSANANMTFRELTAHFMARDIELRKVGKQCVGRWRRTLNTHFCDSLVPHTSMKWGDMKCNDFAVEHWPLYAETLLTLEKRQTLSGDRRGPCTLGDQTDKHAQGLFAYGVAVGVIDPRAVPKRSKVVTKGEANERALSVAEIEQLMRVTTREHVRGDHKKPDDERMNEFDAVFLRLQLMTGARPNSVRLMRRADRDSTIKGFWTFPAKTLKQTKRQKRRPTAHVVPITSLMDAELKRLDDVSGPFQYLFIERYPTADELPAPRSVSWMVHIIADHKDELKNSGDDHYTAYALRRTCSNMMLELGVSPKIVDLCAARALKGTDRTYQTAELRDQVTDAFEQWHAFLLACMAGKGDAFLADVRNERMESRRRETAERLKRLRLKVPAELRA